MMLRLVCRVVARSLRQEKREARTGLPQQSGMFNSGFSSWRDITRLSDALQCETSAKKLKTRGNATAVKYVMHTLVMAEKTRKTPFS